MAYSTPDRRTIVIKASRDTIVLVASTVALTFALSYAVHTRPARVAAMEVQPKQEWVGRLADVASEPKSVQPAETMTSASLVVPAAALTLPTPPRPAPDSPAPANSVKVRTCEASPCAAKLVAPLPPARQKPVTPVEVARVESEQKGSTSGVGRFNPLNHLPDAVRRPFDYAGNTISSWMRRL